MTFLQNGAVVETIDAVPEADNIYAIIKMLISRVHASLGNAQAWHKGSANTTATTMTGTRYADVIAHKASRIEDILQSKIGCRRDPADLSSGTSPVTQLSREVDPEPGDNPFPSVTSHRRWEKAQYSRDVQRRF